MLGRWRRAFALGGGLLAAALPAQASELSGLRDPAEGARIATLENGLTVLLVEDRSTPVVSFQIWVKVGSRDETRFTGIAHLFEHMMFKGTRHLAPEQFTNLVESRGGRLNAFTSRDVTAYFEDVAPESLPLVIDLEAERFANLEITQELLDTERQVVLEERRMRSEDDPQGLAYESLLALAFQAHPYRWPVIGWRSDVEAVDVEWCRRFYESYYAPNNLVVAVAGDFDPEAALARIALRFGGMRPAAEIPRNPTVEPAQRGERRVQVHFDLRGEVLSQAWHAPPAGHPDAAALDALAEILSGGRSSRLYRRLVEDEQVALGAGAQYWELKDAGLFVGRVAVRPDASVARAETLMLEEIERVREQPVTAAELEKARRQLEVGLVQELRTAHALASRVASDWAIFGRIRPLSELLGRIEAVTAEDVQRVARAYLASERRSTVRVVRPEAAP